MMKRFLIPFLIIPTLFLGLINSCISFPDSIPPVVSILNPAPGEIVSGIVPILVTANDDNNVKEIKVFIDGVELITFTESVGNTDWNSGTVAPNQNHHVSAYATDEDDNIGATAIVQVRVTTTVEDTLPPVVTMKNPAAGQTVSGDVILMAEAIDGDRNTINIVEFFIDGIVVGSDTNADDELFSFVWPSASVPAGTHTLFARGVDAGGNAASSATITINTTGNKTGTMLPEITLENISAGARISAANQPYLQLRPQLPAGFPVDYIEYVLDGQRIVRSEAPFDGEWDISQIADGKDHTIFVKAVDIYGNSLANFYPVILDN